MIGILDKDVSAKEVFTHPLLAYNTGRLGELLNNVNMTRYSTCSTRLATRLTSWWPSLTAVLYIYITSTVLVVRVTVVVAPPPMDI